MIAAPTGSVIRIHDIPGVPDELIPHEPVIIRTEEKYAVVSGEDQDGNRTTYRVPHTQYEQVQ